MSVQQPVTRSARAFQGNPNYLDFYNREVKSFFAKDYLGRTKDEKLRVSKINSSGITYYQSDENFHGCGGTLWTRAEKEAFFNCLARYSIHRIDQIVECIPGKSKMEIMTYYNMLREELTRIRKNEKKAKKYKVKIGEQKSSSVKFIKHSRSLVRYSKIPAAYEMSEFLIRVEEAQSALISEFENKRINDENQRFRKLYQGYVGAQTTTVANSLDAEECTPSQNWEKSVGVFTDDADGEIRDDSLINCSNAFELTSSLYIHNRITPIGSTKKAPKLHYKSLVLLENLAKIKLRSIMTNIIQKKRLQYWLNQKESVDEIKIVKADISDAVEELSARVNGSLSVKEYLSHLPHSLSIEVANDYKASEKILDEVEYSKYVAAEKLTKENNPRKLKEGKRNQSSPWNSEAVDSEFLIEERNQLPLVTNNHGTSNVPHISSLVKKPAKITDEDHALVRDVVCHLEEQQLDESDLAESRIYEHSLLTAMLTYNHDLNPQVRESIYSEKDGSVVLENWGDEKKQKHAEPPSMDIDIIENGQTSSEFDDIQIEMSLLHNFDYEFASYREQDEFNFH